MILIMDVLVSHFKYKVSFVKYSHPWKSSSGTVVVNFDNVSLAYTDALSPLQQLSPPLICIVLNLQLFYLVSVFEYSHLFTFYCWHQCPHLFQLNVHLTRHTIKGVVVKLRCASIVDTQITRSLFSGVSAVGSKLRTNAGLVSG